MAAEFPFNALCVFLDTLEEIMLVLMQTVKNSQNDSG